VKRIVTLDPKHPKYDGQKTEIRMVLQGDKGAVQFVCCAPRPAGTSKANFLQTLPSLTVEGWDVGYHDTKPHYDGQTATEFTADWVCPYVPAGSPCYYDGSGLRAHMWVDRILKPGGTRAIWRALRGEYRIVIA
jgi:hypothetical protein